MYFLYIMLGLFAELILFRYEVVCNCAIHSKTWLYITVRVNTCNRTYVEHSKNNETLFAKMHNIWIQNFQFIFLKFSNASFKINITFCYLVFKFWVFAQRIVQKCILRRLALIQVWLFISNKRIVLPKQKFNYSICIILSFTKFVCWAIVSLV